jgi:hypothetical protein
MATDGREATIAPELGRLAHALSNDVGLALAALELLHEQGAVPSPARDWLAAALAALHRAGDHLAALRALQHWPNDAAGPALPLFAPSRRASG